MEAEQKLFNTMAATLFLTNKSVKILVLNNEDDSLFELKEKVFGEQLKNDITFVGSFSGKESDLILATKPDAIIDLKDAKTPNISLDVNNGYVVPRIQNVDVKMLQKYHEIFLLIDQIKQIKSQLKLD